MIGRIILYVFVFPELNSGSLTDYFLKYSNIVLFLYFRSRQDIHVRLTAASQKDYATG